MTVSDPTEDKVSALQKSRAFNLSLALQQNRERAWNAAATHAIHETVATKNRNKMGTKAAYSNRTHKNAGQVIRHQRNWWARSEACKPE